MMEDAATILNEVFGDNGENFGMVFDESAPAEQGGSETVGDSDGDSAGDNGGDNSDAGEQEKSEDSQGDAAPDLSNDALGEAIRKRHALENELKDTKAKASQYELEASRPRFVPFDKLPEDAQEAIAAEAERFGITPEQLTYDIFRKVEADHFSGRNQAQRVPEQSSAVETANAEIEDVFASHPLRSRFEHSEVAAKLLEMGWDNNAKLAATDVNTYRRNAVKLINEAFHQLEAASANKQRALNAKQAAKQSTQSEAARSSAPSTPRSPSPANFADEVYNAMLSNSMSVSEQLRRTTKK